MKFLGEKKVIGSSSGQQISHHDVSKDSGESRSTGSICARCRRLDVPRLFAEYTFSPNNTYHKVKSVGFVGTPRSWDSSCCDLCGMFHSMLATIKTASLDDFVPLEYRPFHDFFPLEDTPFHLIVWKADCVFDLEFANDQNLLFIAPEYLCGPSGLYDDDFEVSMCPLHFPRVATHPHCRPQHALMPTRERLDTRNRLYRMQIYA